MTRRRYQIVRDAVSVCRGRTRPAKQSARGFAGGAARALQPVLVLVIAWSAYQGSAMGATQSPTIRLFPTTVVESLKQTSQESRAMEDSLQGVIADLEQQKILFDQSQCQGAGADPGCDEIVRQMGAKYMALLNQMESHLPNMERSVTVTNEGLEKRIRQELGRKMTPREMQKMLEGNKAAGKRRPGQLKAGRLSEKFRKYYDLVRLGPRSGTGGGSLAAVAADIYLDTRDVLDLIALTRDEIGRAKLAVELNQIYGLITPEMFEVVTGVKGVLFGEVDDGSSIPGPPPGSEDKEFRSPLAM